MCLKAELNRENIGLATNIKQRNFTHVQIICLHFLTKFATWCIFISSGEVHSWYRSSSASRNSSRPTVHPPCCPHRLTRPWGQYINTGKGSHLLTVNVADFELYKVFEAMQIYCWQNWDTKGHIALPETPDWVVSCGWWWAPRRMAAFSGFPDSHIWTSTWLFDNR